MILFRQLWVSYCGMNLEEARNSMFVLADAFKSPRNANDNIPNFAQFALASNTNSRRLLKGCYVRIRKVFRSSGRLD